MEWSQFLENKNNENLEFFMKRKHGAEKIAVEARSKGGPAMLTAWHFQAKQRPYEDVIAAIRSNRPKSFYESKCSALHNQIRCGKLTQQQFQKLMGEYEVWGEALAQLF